MDSILISFLPLFLLILIAWAISHFIKRFANRYPPAGSNEGRFAGVGGWLLLLILGFMFLGPIMNASRINYDFTSVESQYPNLKSIADWSTYKSATWWTFLPFCCLSIYAGVSLVKGRDGSVVKRAIILLWIIGPVASLVMGIFIPLLVFGKIQLDPKFLGSLIASIIAAAIWTTYLSKSMRVRATYGNN
jgi:hypothetical protein